MNKTVQLSYATPYTSPRFLYTTLYHIRPLVIPQESPGQFFAHCLVFKYLILCLFFQGIPESFCSTSPKCIWHSKWSKVDKRRKYLKSALKIWQRQLQKVYKEITILLKKNRKVCNQKQQSSWSRAILNKGLFLGSPKTIQFFSWSNQINC